MRRKESVCYIILAFLFSTPLTWQLTILRNHQFLKRGLRWRLREQSFLKQHIPSFQEIAAKKEKAAAPPEQGRRLIWRAAKHSKQPGTEAAVLLSRVWWLQIPLSPATPVWSPFK